jgi:hypothetical protein
LGVKQESAFWYEQAKVAGKNEWSKEWVFAFNNYSKPYSDIHIVSAFTVAELGEMLPTGLWYEKTTEDNRYRIGHIHELDRGVSPSHVEWADTEADVRAKMLIYLIENNLVTL